MLKLKYVDDLGSSTPARVNRITGECLINKKVWNHLPEAYKKFILLHEEGHYVLQTTDEFEADAYAFDKYAGKAKGSLKNSIKALSDILPFITNEQKDRLNEQIKRALLYDFQKNGNKNALINYMGMIPQDIISLPNKQIDLSRKILTPNSLSTVAGVVNNLPMNNPKPIISTVKNSLSSNLTAYNPGQFVLPVVQERKVITVVDPSQYDSLKNLATEAANAEAPKEDLLLGMKKPLAYVVIGIAAIVLIFIIKKF